jgi:polyhydroxyalkanoate synthesis regulator protein
MIAWTSFGNPLNKYHPIRPFILLYYGNIMNTLIKKELEDRFHEYKQDNSSLNNSKSVIALTLETYLKGGHRRDNKVLDKTFAAYATYQIRLFLFAGHDTTTSVLVYVYHMLHKHSQVRSRMLEEHSSIFGSDPSSVAAQLRLNPALINKTSYTLAVIKETMRMYTPAGAFREGGPGISLVDEQGLQFPTQDCLISIVHHAIHVNPRIWPRAEEFLPERWLVEVGDDLYPPNGAFRSFEQGPRNCIGQNLSLIELRVALVMTIRTFCIRPAYKEWDTAKKGNLLEWCSFRKAKNNEINRDRAYQIEKGGAHPAEGYPCSVKII